MSSGICGFGFDDYEPESYKQMLNDLESEKNRLHSVTKGSIPSETLIGFYLNFLYSLDNSCPFCHIDRKAEVITIKSRSGDIFDLKEKLEAEEKHLVWWHERRSEHRSLPKLGPHFIQFSDIGFHYTLVVTWNIAKGLVKKGIYEAIDAQEATIDSYKDDMEDYPLFNERFKRVEQGFYDVEDALETRATGDDCDKLIRWLESKAQKVRRIRDEKFNQKLPVSIPIPKNQARLVGARE